MWTYRQREPLFARRFLLSKILAGLLAFAVVLGAGAAVAQQAVSIDISAVRDPSGDLAFYATFDPAIPLRDAPEDDARVVQWEILGTGIDGGTPINDGVAAFMPDWSPNPGNYTIRAVWVGDAVYAAQTEDFQITIRHLSSSGIGRTPNADTTVGQSLQIHASVEGSDGVTPTGTITFLDGGTPIGTATLSPTGFGLNAQATLTTSALSAGAHTLSFTYGGDTSYQPSAGASFVHNVTAAGPAPVDISIDMQLDPSGNRLFTATFDPPISAGDPARTIEWELFGQGLTATRPIDNGTSTYDPSWSPPSHGTYTAIARWLGDDDYAAQTAQLQFTIHPIGPRGMSLVPNTDTMFGEPLQINASVDGTNGTVPTGTVTFFDGASAIGTVALGPGSGLTARASLTTSALSVGTHTISYSYGGDETFLPAAGPSQAHTVTPFVAPTISLPAATLDGAIVGTAYSDTLPAASGGTGPYTYSLDSGALPAGLTLDGPSGTISGTPTASGSFNFVVRATDSSDAPGPYSQTQSYSIAVGVPGALAVSEGDLVSVGPYPGPYLPASKTWTVTNTGDTDITIEFNLGNPSSFDIDRAVNTDVLLPAGQSTEVTVSVDTVNLFPSTGIRNGQLLVRDITNNVTTTRAASVDVQEAETWWTVTSSPNPSQPGEPVTVTVTLTSAVPGPIDGVARLRSAGGAQLGGTQYSDQPMIFVLDNLPAGSNVITVEGSAQSSVHSSPPNVTFTQIVSGSGAGTIQFDVVAEGADGTIGFASPTQNLNTSVTTSAGTGSTGALSVAAETHTVSLADVTAAGLQLSSILCDDDDSFGDATTGEISIAVADGEDVTCTVTVRRAFDAAATISDFLATRADLILGNLPDSQRRFDRLNGVAGSNDPGSAVMAYLPELAQGNLPDLSASLSGIEAAAGNQQMAPFDAWVEGTFALYDRAGKSGQFGVVALGADYLVSPDLLIGGFGQFDLMGEDGLSGTGWLAGPYATARLAEGLYLDMLAAAGRSANEISPAAGMTDSFGGTRWLVSGTLSGAITLDQLTIQPSARLSYFEETSDSYIDGFGLAVPSVTQGTGQAALGTGFAYRLEGDGSITTTTLLRLDLVAGMDRAAGFTGVSGRVETGIRFGFAGGASLDASASYDGLGNPGFSAIGGTIRLSAPLR